MKIIEAEISKPLHKCVIVQTTRKPNDCVSGISTRTKKDGMYRMILNLKRLNGFLKFRHLKLESIENVLDLVTQGWLF